MPVGPPALPHILRLLPAAGGRAATLPTAGRAGGGRGSSSSSPSAALLLLLLLAAAPAPSAARAAERPAASCRLRRDAGPGRARRPQKRAGGPPRLRGPAAAG